MRPLNVGEDVFVGQVIWQPGYEVIYLTGTVTEVTPKFVTVKLSGGPALRFHPVYLYCIKDPQAGTNFYFLDGSSFEARRRLEDLRDSAFRMRLGLKDLNEFCFPMDRSLERIQRDLQSKVNRMSADLEQFHWILAVEEWAASVATWLNRVLGSVPSHLSRYNIKIEVTKKENHEH